MITSKQRAYLRSMANTADTIGQIGKDGITDSVISQMENAIRARELIKLRVLETSMLSAKEACGILCEALGAETVQCIGSKMVIYRPNPEKPVIELPKK